MVEGSQTWFFFFLSTISWNNYKKNKSNEYFLFLLKRNKYINIIVLCKYNEFDIMVMSYESSLSYNKMPVLCIIGLQEVASCARDLWELNL